MQLFPANFSTNLPTYEVATFPPEEKLWFMDKVSVLTIQEFAKFTQFFWKTVGMPEEILKHDRLFYHTTSRHQEVFENAWTGVMYFVVVFLCLIAVDFGFSRPVTWLFLKARGKNIPVKKCSWFLLHAIFNTFVMIVSWTEAWVSFFYPTTKCVDPPSWWGVHPGALMGTIAIGAFHIHHFFFFDFNFEDVVHHLGNAGGVVCIGITCPWQKGLSLNNMAMCAIPGGVNYFNMWLRKMDLISTPLQKQINRALNIMMRYPLMLCSLYLFLVNMWEEHAPVINGWTYFFMWFGLIAQCLNALYYADQVVGNFWVYHHEIAQAKKIAANKNKSE